MLIITIRTDKPEAEIGLYDSQQQLAYANWQAHRELAETLHSKIAELLQSQQKTLQDIQGIVIYRGPGSFTGLRIGISVANALANSIQVPVVGSSDPEWLVSGISELLSGKNDTIVLPKYGAPVHITPPKL